MAPYVLTCCSTADMDEGFFARRKIPYLCYHYIIDGKQYPDDLGKTVPFEEFYRKLTEGAQPTTSQICAGEYIDFFERFLKQGLDILHVCLSSGISGSYGSACIAKKELSEKYPDRQIEVVDSLGASSGYGLLIDMLADRRDAGAELNELRMWAEENRLNIHHWFFSADLTFYISGGRISKTKGYFGKLLGICPVMNMDEKGRLIPREKVHTKKKAVERLAEKMRKHAVGGAEYSGKCFLSHSACPAEAEALAALVEQTFPRLDGKVVINSIGTVIGSHSGPGTVALFFVGDSRGAEAMGE